ncbi:MAG: hypothetical protein ABW252_15435 [Polyangiales bacterium]
MLLLTTGCSVINEAEDLQCTGDDECVARFASDVGVSCVQNFCVRPACTADTQCRQRGERYQGSVCAPDGYCAAAEAVSAACVTKADCNSPSPTMECVGGRCEDKIWGCRGQPDERPPIMHATATLQTTVYDLGTRMPVGAITAKACLLPTFDLGCDRPLLGTASTYDRNTGQLTVTGLPQETPFRLKLDFPPDSGLIPLDQYATRTAHDITVMPLLTTIPASIAPSLIAAVDPPRVLGPNNASIAAVVVDCRNEPAIGAEVRVVEQDRIEGTEVLYFGADGQVAPRATSTVGYGSALIINVKPTTLLTVQVWVGAMLINEHRVYAFPRRSTAVHFFPRNYVDRTAGGT